MSFRARYKKLFEQGKLQLRVADAYKLLESCTLCARVCHVNRLAGVSGVCRGGVLPRVSSVGAHFGEEAPLVGTRGSGTIFFTGCNLVCLFCQNYSLSIHNEGDEITPQQLAGHMLRLQNKGCHNINLVTPTHFMPQILHALMYAIAEGLELPIVYNCGGYESREALELLEGIVDIYMPDVKFFDAESARQYCNAPDYPEVVKEALKIMQSQVGSLKINKLGIAERGLLIRHLIMPGHTEDSAAILDFITQELGSDAYVNVMDQYRPLYKAHLYPEINRGITHAEYRFVCEYARKSGLTRGFVSA